MRGPAEPAPGYNLHPFESRSPQGGVNERGRRQLSGRGLPRAIYWTDDSDCACLSPGEWTQTGDPRLQGERAGTRRNDEERGRETALPYKVPAALSPAR